VKGSGGATDASRRRRASERLFPVATISGFVLPTMATSSFCSAAGTLKASSVFWKSATIASHCFSVMLRWVWDVLMSRSTYLQG
jgi:hypothetical protein